MPKDKTQTYERIMTAAKAEFLEKGYEKASIRTIAAAAGITSAALYRHFADKEAMFAALVQPTLDELAVWCAKMEERDYLLLENHQLEAMWEDGADMAVFLDFIYNGHFDEFKLLLCCSAGTAQANFLEQFIEMEMQMTVKFLEAARLAGQEVPDLDLRELHLLLHAYDAAIFEVVVHDFTQAEAEHYLHTLQRFFYPGWRVILGL